MNKTALVAVAIVVVIVIAAVLVLNRPTATTPTNSSTTTSSTVTSQSAMTSSTTTSTTRTVTAIRPYTLYFLNETNGSYYYVAVLNSSIPAKIVTVAWGQSAYPAFQHTLDGYVIAVFALPQYINYSVTLFFFLNNGEMLGHQFTFGGQWPYGQVV